MTPPVLVMVNACTARAGKAEAAGGAVTWSRPHWTRLQLILVNNWLPVSGPDWPSRAVLLWFLASAVQAARWASVTRARRRRRRARCCRTAADRGAGVGGDDERAADLAVAAALGHSVRVYRTGGCRVSSYVSYFLLLFGLLL